MDAVIAKGMAKDPSERYSSTLELARAARMALDAPAHQLTVPSPDATQLRTSAVPAPAVPVAAEGGSGRRSPRRIGILVTAILTTIAVGAGIFAVVKLTNRQEPPAPKPAGPIDGMFTAAFGPRTSIGGDPYTGTLSSAPLEGTWSIRSACPANQCVATASRTPGTRNRRRLYSTRSAASGFPSPCEKASARTSITIFGPFSCCNANRTELSPANTSRRPRPNVLRSRP